MDSGKQGQVGLRCVLVGHRLLHQDATDWQRRQGKRPQQDVLSGFEGRHQERLRPSTTALPLGRCDASGTLSIRSDRRAREPGWGVAALDRILSIGRCRWLLCGLAWICLAPGCPKHLSSTVSSNVSSTRAGSQPTTRPEKAQTTLRATTERATRRGQLGRDEAIAASEKAITAVGVDVGRYFRRSVFRHPGDWQIIYELKEPRPYLGGDTVISVLVGDNGSTRVRFGR